jgi:hypothetical protein
MPTSIVRFAASKKLYAAKLETSKRTGNYLVDECP